MSSTPRISALATLVFLSTATEARAGTITAQGNVTALTHVDQLKGIVGTASFDEELAGNVPLDQYTPQGMTLHTGPLAAILPGVTTLGSAVQPAYQVNGNFFPAPIGGGGLGEESYSFKGGALTFAEPITQFGLTASNNGNQYITAWDANGALIGQVKWTPNADSAFVGIDTNGVPIGLLTFGNDNLWTGATYDIAGLAIYSDTWIWAGIACQVDADCQPDANECTADSCLAGVCQQPFTVDPCDDLDACTENDLCGAGECLGSPVDCDDDDPCTVEQCDVALGCVIEVMPGCCTSDEQCMPGEICQFGSNSCIPEPAGDSTTDGGDSSTGESDSSTDDGSTSEGDSSTTAGTDETEGLDEIGEDVGTLDTFGGTPDEAGCGCATEPHEGGVLFGLLGLGLLALARRGSTVKLAVRPELKDSAQSTSRLR